MVWCLYLDDDTHDTLYGHEDDGRHAVLRGCSPPIPATLALPGGGGRKMLPYGVLSLQTEEEAGGEVMQPVHTHLARVPVLLHVPYGQSSEYHTESYQAPPWPRATRYHSTTNTSQDR